MLRPLKPDRKRTTGGLRKLVQIHPLVRRNQPGGGDIRYDRKKHGLMQIINVFFQQRYDFSNKLPNWLQNLLQLLNNPKYFFESVETIAKMTPYSYSRLSRLFKHYLQKTLKEYTTDIKMRYTKELLKNTDMTTLDICSKISFDSLSHFNHLFKNLYGLTPIEYRKKSKQK